MLNKAVNVLVIQNHLMSWKIKWLLLHWTSPVQPPVRTPVLSLFTYISSVNINALYDNITTLYMVMSYIYDYAMYIYMRSHHHHIYHNTLSFAKTSCLESCWDYEFNPVSVPSVSWSQFSALVAEVVQVGWLENSRMWVCQITSCFSAREARWQVFPQVGNLYQGQQLESNNPSFEALRTLLSA